MTAAARRIRMRAASPRRVAAALRAGARGYFVKGAGRDEIASALAAVAAGRAFLGAEVADSALARLSRADPAPPPFPELMEREREGSTSSPAG